MCSTPNLVRGHVPQGGDVSEVGLDAGLRWWQAQDFLELLLLGAGEFRGVLISGVTGHDGMQSGAPPVREPFLHGSLALVDHFSDNTHVDAGGRVENRLGFQSDQDQRVVALLPLQKDIALIRRDINPHAPILYPAHTKIHPRTHRNTVLFKAGYIRNGQQPAAVPFWKCRQFPRSLTMEPQVGPRLGRLARRQDRVLMRTTRPRGSGRQRSHQQQVVTPRPEFDTGPLSSTLKPQFHSTELGLFFYNLGFYCWVLWSTEVVFLWGRGLWDVDLARM